MSGATIFSCPYKCEVNTSKMPKKIGLNSTVSLYLKSPRANEQRKFSE